MRRALLIALTAVLLVGTAVAGEIGSAGPARPLPGSVAAAAVSGRPLRGVVAATAPATAPRAPAGWIEDVEEIVAGHSVSVAIGLGGEWLYRHGARVARPPASNEKLLLSMALLDRFPIWTRIRTDVVATGRRVGHRLLGDLWIVGHGDPEVNGRTLRKLARGVRDAGLRTVRGRVIGVTTGFKRDWWAAGWRDYFPADYIPLPTALTFEGNEDRYGRNIGDPERRAASSLTERLRSMGVRVTGDPGASPAPTGPRTVASVASAPFRFLLQRMNRASRNFHAEVLGKWLGHRAVGPPGSIAKGALAIERFAEDHGAAVVANDASGLSYQNRVRAEDLVELLWFAAAQGWWDGLRLSLPKGGQGTLEGRLRDVRVRAKTGTLEEVSALSGWVWLEKAGAWGEFSILSQGMSKTQSMGIEDRIVRIVANRASS